MFVTDAIEAWAKECKPLIELQPCIPHEHHSIGDIECFNQTMGDAIFKKLQGQKHLSVHYWDMAYTDNIAQRYILKEASYRLILSEKSFR